MNPLEVAKTTALAYLGTPYKWGGNDPMAGFDCSGFVIELLQSAGELPLKGDWTAEDLYEHFKDKEVSAPIEGCLVFFAGINTNIYHIEFCLDNCFSIGASAGDSSTVTVQDAIDQNAHVKIRPIRRGNALLKFVNPFKEV
jgi:hypothetical protein